MTRSAAAKATQAADAVLDWLRRQPPPVVSARTGRPNAVPPRPDAGAADLPLGAAAAGHPAESAGGDGPAGAAPIAAAPEPPPAAIDDRESIPRTATSSGSGDGSGGAPLRLPHTDWLYHRLSITGPPAAVAAFRAAAAGAGVIPWQLNRERLEEDFFHLLAAPPPPQQRSLSLAGARIVAGQLRDAVARRHDLAVARVGRSRACPFDLHALVPVPEAILRRGPDDAVSVAWLWQHWGTTRELRHVVADTAAGREQSRQSGVAAEDIRLTFWSADWSPWHALAQIAAGFPALRFALRPGYDPA